MKTGTKRLVILGLIALVLSVMSLLLYARNEERGEGEAELSISQVPSAVRATIEKKCAGAKIKEIELGEEGGRQVYEVKALKGDEEVEFKVARDGKFLGYEEENEGEERDEGKAEIGEEEGQEEEEEESVPFASLPAAVKEAAEQYLVSDVPFKASKETEHGETLYEVEGKKNGLEQSIKVSKDGQIWEIEKEVKVSALPKNVVSSIERRFPGAQIKEAAVVQKFSYEVDIVVNGKRREVKVYPTGKIKSHHHEYEAENEEGEKESEERD